MNRKSIPIIFITIMVFIGIIILFTTAPIKQYATQQIISHKYIPVILFSFLADFLLQFMSPEVVSILAITEQLNIFYVFLFTLIGSYTGSILSFLIGHQYFSKNLSQKTSLEKQAKYSDIFYKYGHFIILIGAILPLPFTIFCWYAGTFKMTLGEFTTFGLVPRTIRIAFVIFLFKAMTLVI